MANWCSTSIKFYGNSEPSLVETFRNYLLSIQPSDGHFGLNECLAKDVGIESCGSGGYIDFIGDYDDVYDMFEIETFTKWVPNLEIFREVIDKKFGDDSIHYCFIAEEPGCDIFCKHDPKGFYEENFVYMDDDVTEYYTNAEEIINFIYDKYLGLDDTDKFKDYVYDNNLGNNYLDNLVAYVNEDDGVYVSVRQFEIVGAYEF